VLVAVVVLAAALRCWGLGAQSLWYDEWLTTEATAGGVGDLMRHVGEREGITPPYFAVMWLWARVVGDGDAALRSFSVLAGVATVPVAYALAVELGQRRAVARAAALLVAVNPMLVWYSQEARPYTLLALAGALSLWAAVRADRTGRRRDALIWGGAAAAAVAVHYFAVFLVIAEGVALLARRRVPARLLALAAAPVAVVLVALMPVALEQSSHTANRSWISDFSLRSRVDDTVRTVAIGPSPRYGWLWLVALALIVAGALVALSRSAPRDRGVVLAVAGVAVLGFALPLAVAVVGVDVFLGRYLIAALVPFVVAVAVALLAGATTGRAWLGGGAVAAVAVLWLAADVAVARDPQLQRSDWRAVAEAVDAGAADAPGDEAAAGVADAPGDEAVAGVAEGALVLNVGGGQSSPLGRYLPGGRPLGPAETVVTDRVDVLVARSSEAPCNFFVGRACSFVFLGAPLPAPVADRFRLDERVELGQFFLDRYRADGPVRLGRDDLLDPADRAGGTVWTW
jgi:4-amino-4-deoxy-L-arabinose transferase-like glycosyltransferase